MVVYHFALIALTCLLRARSSSQAPPTVDPKCLGGKSVRPSDCQMAYGKIKYEPDSTIHKTETHIERAFGNCVVIVVKTQATIVNQQTVTDGFLTMMSKCKNSPANYSLPGLDGAYLEIRPWGSLPFTIEDDTKFLEPVCKDNVKGMNTKLPADCLSAYGSLPTDHQGRFSSDTSQPINVAKREFKTCSVAIFTSDGTVIKATKTDVGATFSKTVEKCQDKWAAVAFENGTEGPNGRLIMIAIPTKRR